MKTIKKTLTLAGMVVLLGMLFGSVLVQAQTFAYVTTGGSTSSRDIVSVIATASNTDRFQAKRFALSKKLVLMK